MTDWQYISEQSKKMTEINSEIFPSDGSRNCSMTDTKEAKRWHAKGFKSYMTGCLHCKKLLHTSMSQSLLSFMLMVKENPYAQIWLWNFPVVIHLLSGTRYTILYHLPQCMQMSVITSRVPREESINNFHRTNLFWMQNCQYWHVWSRYC